MMSPEEKVYQILSNRKRLALLYKMDKERRGFKQDALVFLGVSNIAQYYWCAMQALYKSRAAETNFFRNYLHDKLLYSLELGRVKTLPEDDKKLLAVGDDIRNEEVQFLLKKRENEKIELRASGIELIVEMDSIVSIDKNGKKVKVNNPLVTHECTDDEDCYVAQPGEFPLIEGQLYEYHKAEKYPKICWNYLWEKYVIVGVPDGISDEFAYEFKAYGTGFIQYNLPVAKAQVNLYSFFMQKPQRRLQIYIKSDGRTETYQEPTDPVAAERLLREFLRVDQGARPVPPRPFKCTRCDFSNNCNIVPKSRD